MIISCVSLNRSSAIPCTLPSKSKTNEAMSLCTLVQLTFIHLNIQFQRKET